MSLALASCGGGGGGGTGQVIQPDKKKVLDAPKLLADLGQPERGSDAESSSPSAAVRLGSSILFAARTPEHGPELFISDLSSAGTRLVKDIWPGRDGSSPGLLVSDGKLVYFRASHPDLGTEIWVSDGTEAGTRLVRELEPGRSSSRINGLVALRQGILFSRSTSSGQELWRSDGTEAGTRILRKFAGRSFESISLFIVMNGHAYFTAVDGLTGAELWESDGTVTGTRLAADIDPGTGKVPFSSRPSNFFAFGTLLVFQATRSDVGKEAFVYDTIRRTHSLLVDALPGTGSGGARNFGAVGGGLFVFTARTDTTGGFHLFLSNGKSTSTRGIHDFKSPSVFNIGSIGGHALFALDQKELWVSDGSSQGTKKLVDDIRVKASLYKVGSTALFVATRDGLGSELWRSNGTVAGTQPLDLVPGETGSTPRLLAVTGDRLFFSAELTVGNGLEPCVSDGTLQGTQQIVDLAKDPGDAEVAALTDLQGSLFFRAKAGTLGPELHRVDDAGQVTRLSQIFDDGRFDGPRFMTGLGSQVLFIASDGLRGAELWRIQQDGSGLEFVKDIRPGQSGSWPCFRGSSGFVRLGDELLFVANDGTHGRELWSTDGTAAETRLVLDSQPGRGNGASMCTPMIPGIVIDGKLLYAGSDAIVRSRLFATDGTAAGTQRVAVRQGGAERSNVFFLGQLPGLAFFAAETQSRGRKRPFVSDGTSNGTRLLADASVILNSFSSTPERNAVVFNGRFFFVANDDVHGEELWSTDGTPEGTAMLVDIREGEGSASPDKLTVLGDKLFFVANDPKLGEELWVTDGTADGTRLVRDLLPGAFSSRPSALCAVPELKKLFFAAFTEETGFELFETDGSTRGTKVFADLVPGPGSSEPEQLLFSSKRLFFVARDATRGRELFAAEIVER